MKSILKFFDLPPIVQGAIGSALFWLILVLSQKAIGGLTKFGGAAKKEALWRELIHEKFFRQRLPILHAVMTACQYQALSFFARGAIFLGLGVLASPIFKLSLTVGAAGFLYYTYRALRWLKPYTLESDESELQIWTRIAEVEKELFGAASADTLAKIESLNTATGQK